MKRKNEVPLADRVVLSVEDAAAFSGFSRSTLYEAMNSGKLIARKEGARTVILRDDLDEWLKALPKRTGRVAVA